MTKNKEFTGKTLFSFSTFLNADTGCANITYLGTEGYYELDTEGENLILEADTLDEFIEQLIEFRDYINQAN